MRKRVARIFEDVGGLYVCSDAGLLDTRGQAHPDRASARRAAWEAGYTHAVVGGREVRLRKPRHGDTRYRAQNIAYKRARRAERE